MTIKRIIDPHIHLWDLNHIKYHWLSPPFDDSGVNGSTEAIAKDYYFHDYLEDAKDYRPQGVVHIDAGADANDCLRETEWLDGLDTDGVKMAIIGYAAFHEKNVDEILAEHSKTDKMRGIRQIMNWHPNSYYSYTPENYFENPEWEKGYSLLEKYNMSFDLQLYPLQMLQAAKICSKYPNIPVMINHAGMPINDSPETLNLWKEGIKSLSQNPNVSIKLSGFGFVKRDWDEDFIRPLILTAIDIFGIDRCMFASDFPTDKLFSDFNKIYEAFDNITKDFNEEERDKLFYKNANKIYRMGLND